MSCLLLAAEVAQERRLRRLLLPRAVLVVEVVPEQAVFMLLLIAVRLKPLRLVRVARQARRVLLVQRAVMVGLAAIRHSELS